MVQLSLDGKYLAKGYIIILTSNYKVMFFVE